MSQSLVESENLPPAVRAMAAKIVRENAAWAKLRGHTFVAEERTRIAERIEAGGAVELYLEMEARSRLGLPADDPRETDDVHPNGMQEP